MTIQWTCRACHRSYETTLTDDQAAALRAYGLTNLKPTKCDECDAADVAGFDLDEKHDTICRNLASASHAKEIAKHYRSLARRFDDGSFDRRKYELMASRINSYALGARATSDDGGWKPKKKAQYAMAR